MFGLFKDMNVSTYIHTRIHESFSFLNAALPQRSLFVQILLWQQSEVDKNKNLQKKLERSLLWKAHRDTT